MTCQVATEPQESLDCSGDPTQEDHLAQAISLGGESPQGLGLLCQSGSLEDMPARLCCLLLPCVRAAGHRVSPDRMQTVEAKAQPC